VTGGAGGRMRARAIGLSTLALLAIAELAWWRLSVAPVAPPPAVAHDDGGLPWLDDAIDDDPDASSSSVAYDCAGLPFDDASVTCDDAPTALSRLVEASENDPSSRTAGLDDADWALWREAVRGASTLDATKLSTEERIVAQNALLRIGVRSMGRDESDARNDIARDCAQGVARLALPAPALAELGDAAEPGVERWLGPRDAWIDKHPFTRPLMHDGVFAFTMAFRPIGTGRLRARMGQLVAVDTDGLAHVTALVGKIELRRGHAHGAPACVLLRDPRRSRCGVPAGLRAVVSLDHLPANTFFNRVAPGRVGCESCHGGSSPFNLAPFDAGEAEPQMRDRRLSFLATASDRAAELARLR
jgi:hypothetical protein